MPHRNVLVFSALFVLLAVSTAVPALAQGAGEPNLDPTGGSTGTAYDFSVQGSSKPLDPSGGQGSTGKLAGVLTIFQSAGSSSFDADILIDTDRDGSATGTMTCDGFVGAGRMAMACNGISEDGDDIFVLIQSKAVSKKGKVVFLAGKGMGFTESSSLSFVFQGAQQ